MADEIDDVFDEEADDLEIERREWEKLCRARKKEGFRDGISCGQESMLQKGFNDGFTQNSQIFHKLSRLRGYLCGLIGPARMNKHSDIPPLLVMKLETLIEKLSNTEQKWLESFAKPVNKVPLVTKMEAKQPDREDNDSQDGSRETGDACMPVVSSQPSDNGTIHQLDTKVQELSQIKDYIEELFKEYDLPCTFLHLL